MCEALEVPEPGAKRKPCATIASPPAENNIVDFVPIPDNANDFEIGPLLRSVLDPNTPVPDFNNAVAAEEF